MRERLAHVLDIGRLLLQRLRVHGVVVVDGEHVPDVQAALLEGAIEGIGDDRSAQARNRDGARRRLGVADHVLAIGGEEVRLLVRPEARLVTLLRPFGRHARGGLYAQLTARIFISMVPAGIETFTVSPARWP